MSASDIFTSAAYPAKHELTKLRYSIMSAAAGVPVYMVESPSGVADKFRSLTTFFILRGSEHAIGLLLSAQLEAVTRLDCKHATVDLLELQRQLRRRGSGGANTCAIYAAAFGVREAARLMHRKAVSVVAAAGSASSAADDEQRRYAVRLLIACADAGISDPAEVRRQILPVTHAPSHRPS